MSVTEGMGRPRRPRRPIRRIVIVAILLAALLEPLFMYRSLQREREQRQAMAGGATELPAASASANDSLAR